LQKYDGTIISLRIEKLSTADQDYVRRRASSGTMPKDVPPARKGSRREPSELELNCQDLCEAITAGYKGKDEGAKATIAVVEFSDLSGGVNDFGRLLSEELITKLFSTGKYKVIERLLLNKAIAEHKLQLQGLIDPKSAKELGKILGVDAIVSGTIADLRGSLRVNARLISAETGEVFSVAAATIIKDDDIMGLLSGDGSNLPARRSAEADGDEHEPAKVGDLDTRDGAENGRKGQPRPRRSTVPRSSDPFGAPVAPGPHPADDPFGAPVAPGPRPADDPFAIPSQRQR
jgi:TolB-like protein